MVALASFPGLEGQCLTTYLPVLLRGTHPAHTVAPSELVLEGLRGEGLDDGLGRLRLHQHHLAEHFTLPSLGCWLLAGFDHHQAWHDKLTILLRLGSRNARQSAQSLADHSLLHLAALRNRCCQHRLGHHRTLHHRCHLCRYRWT